MSEREKTPNELEVTNNEQHNDATKHESTKHESHDKDSPPVSSMRNFYVIASGYLLFTLTDSGLRMIVLLELYNRHFNVCNYL